MMLPISDKSRAASGSGDIAELIRFIKGSGLEYRMAGFDTVVEGD